MSTHIILVGVDFSPESETAVKLAAAIARHTGAAVELFHAVDRLREIKSLDLVGDNVVSWNDHQATFHNRARAHLDKLLKAHATGVTVRPSVIVEAFPDDGLCNRASEIGADLVIVGTEGKTGLSRFFLGSIAEKVIRQCTADVAVARPPIAQTDGFARIAVAVDFSDVSVHALELATELVAHDGVVDLLHCWQLPMPPDEVFDPQILQVDRELNDAISERAKALVAEHPIAHATVNFHTINAAPGPGIREWLETHGYDLVILGSHGRRGIRRFILGSVAEYVVRHAPCSIAVVHGAAHDTHS